MPEISIIVPIYNVEKYLSKCIESILSQSFENFELILVNDGSPDGSGKVCDDYAAKDKRVKVIHKKNGGVSSARNTGVDKAIGNYIGFVDPDDYIDKDMYLKFFNLCKENNSDIAICKLGREIDGKLVHKEEKEKILLLDNVEGLRELFKGILYRFSLCNKLFKKACFDGVRFPEGRIHEDLSTTYRLFANSNKSVYTNYAGYIYVKRENSILTSTYNEKRLQAFIGWDEIILFMKKNYIEVIDNVIETFIYWSIDNIYYILDQVRDKKTSIKYLHEIQNHLRANGKLVSYNNKNLSLIDKMKINIIRNSINLFLLINKLKKR